MFQFTVPGFKQPGDLLNLLGLFHRVQTDLSCELAVQTGRWYLPGGTGGKFVDSFTEFFEHFDGCADLSGGWCLHNQMWMPRDDLWVSSCRRHESLLTTDCMSLVTSGAIGCAHGLLKPSLAAASSAAIFVGASTVVRSGSPIIRAYSRSV